jgi:hypothetical protein
VPLSSAPGAGEEPVQEDTAYLTAAEEPDSADLPAPAAQELPPTLTIAPAPGAAPGDEAPVEADEALEAESVESEPDAEPAIARLSEIDAGEGASVAEVDEEAEAEAAEVSALAPDEDEDLAPWETPPASTEPPPARPAPAPQGASKEAPAARATTAGPAPKARPAAAPAAPPAARTGGVALPNRREAAQIAARTPAPPVPAVPVPPARPGAPAPRPASARPAPARPTATRRLMTDDGEEELLAPRTRAARPAPPPPRKRKRSNTANKFAYQVMTVVIALVLIVGTVASFLSGTITPAVLDTPTPGAGAAAPLVASGNSAAQAGNWAQALQAFQQALQVEPQNVQATLGLAEVYMSMTPPNPQQANAYAQQVIRTAPGSTEATTARNILAALSLTPQTTATSSGGAAPTPAAATPAATSPAAAPTTAATPAP